MSGALDYAHFMPLLVDTMVFTFRVWGEDGKFYNLQT